MAGVLLLPVRVMCCPGVPVLLEVVICTKIPEAAVTALAALSMPEPQVALEHTHSTAWLVSV